MYSQSSKTKRISPLSFMQFNCQDIRNSSSELKNYLYSFYPICACLSETFLKPKNKFKIPGYKVLRGDRLSAQRGGLAILIKNKTPFMETELAPFPDGFLEVQGVKISINNRWVHVLNVYNPCKNITIEEFEHYFDQLSADQLILGDFNGHHPDWSRPHPTRSVSSVNQTGTSLSEVLLNNSSAVLLTPKGLPTRLDPNGTLSTLDLAIGTNRFTNPLSVEAGPDIGSDHFPVVISFGPSIKPPKISIRPKWVINEEMIKRWREDLAKESFPRHDDAFSAYEDFKTRLVDFSQKYFKLKTSTTHSTPGKPWWNSEVSLAIAKRRQAKNTLFRYPSIDNTIAHNRACAVARRAVIKASQRGILVQISPVSKQ